MNFEDFECEKHKWRQKIRGLHLICFQHYLSSLQWNFEPYLFRHVLNFWSFVNRSLPNFQSPICRRRLALTINLSKNFARILLLLNRLQLKKTVFLITTKATLKTFLFCCSRSAKTAINAHLLVREWLETTAHAQRFLNPVNIMRLFYRNRSFWDDSRAVSICSSQLFRNHGKASRSSTSCFYRHKRKVLRPPFLRMPVLLEMFRKLPFSRLRPFRRCPCQSKLRPKTCPRVQTLQAPRTFLGWQGVTFPPFPGCPSCYYPNYHNFKFCQMFTSPSIPIST